MIFWVKFMLLIPGTSNFIETGVSGVDYVFKTYMSAALDQHNAKRTMAVGNKE